MRNMDGLNAALRALPKEMSASLRDESQAIAGVIAGQARGLGMSKGGVTAKVAMTTKARRDRVPVIAIGGSKRLRKGSAQQNLGELTFGAEFGGGAFGARNPRPVTGGRTVQFAPHLGTTGYFLWPTIRARLSWAMDAWGEAIYEGALAASGRGR
jgi:hypothetical protein